MVANNNELYIGLMSGTSLDAVDAALIDFTNNQPNLIATHKHDIPPKLRQDILDLCKPGDNEIHRMGEIDCKLGHLFADSVIALLKNSGLNAKNIRAIGSHGQTVRHAPNSTHPFTLQIGDPNIIAAKTGVTTVADFRRRDMAHGGQAAPLAPAFHHYLFQKRSSDIAVVNIGGIANVTLLPADPKQPIIGFDTGPGNTLIDAWCFKHTGNNFDKDGEWALSGQCDEALLQTLLSDAYFKKAPPKSTGREYFHLEWLTNQLSSSIKPEDVQATLLELTVRSIIDCFKYMDPRISLRDSEDDAKLSPSFLYICGGGAQNTALMKRIKEMSSSPVESTEQIGIHPDWIEAAAFAWLAQQTLLGKPGNIPSVTGAKCETILGAIYPKN